MVYTESINPNTPIGTPILAIQLIESAILLLLYLVLLLLYYKGKTAGICSIVYVAAYAIIRFTLEFFRGDE